MLDYFDHYVKYIITDPSPHGVSFARHSSFNGEPATVRLGVRACYSLAAATPAAALNPSKANRCLCETTSCENRLSTRTVGGSGLLGSSCWPSKRICKQIQTLASGHGDRTALVVSPCVKERTGGVARIRGNLFA